MQFTAETRGYLKCRISPRLHEWVDVRTDAYRRFSQNQNFLDASITKFSYPWCSATNKRVNFAEKKSTMKLFENTLKKKKKVKSRPRPRI